MAIILPVRFVVEDGGTVLAAKVMEEGEIFPRAADHAFLFFLSLIPAVDEDMAQLFKTVLVFFHHLFGEVAQAFQIFRRGIVDLRARQV